MFGTHVSKLIAIRVAQDVLMRIMRTMGQMNAEQYEKNLIFKIQTAHMGFFCNLLYRAHLKVLARLPHPWYMVDALHQ